MAQVVFESLKNCFKDDIYKTGQETSLNVFPLSIIEEELEYYLI